MNRSRTAVLATFFVAAGCSGDSGGSTTTPPDKTACGTGGTVQLAVLQAATVDCSVGTTVTLQGAGASYIVVPQLATYGEANRATPYALSADGASTSARESESTGIVPANLSAARFSVDAAALDGSPKPGARQRSFDAALRATSRTAPRSAWSGAGVQTQGAVASARKSGQTPPLGSVRGFSVLASNDPHVSAFKDVAAKLAYAGDNILIYTDTSGASTGFTQAQMNDFGYLFDQVLYNLDVTTFGAVSDIDQNGRMLVLLSPVVNALSPAAQCNNAGYVAGFFNPFDISSKTANSNQGEVFYGLVPDPTGKFSCSHTVSSVGTTLPGVFLHEMQHMISFSQHTVVHSGSQEEGWLDEGLSLIAEELGSKYYEDKFPAPTGRSNPGLLFPDSAALFILGDIVNSYAYLLNPDVYALTLAVSGDVGLESRGGDWLLLRYLGDQQGSDFYKRLDSNTTVGIANVESVTGRKFQSLFGDFSLALYADSIQGVARSSVPSANRFSSRILRQMYQSLYNGSSSSDVPRAFPLLLKTLTSKAASATLNPGAMGFYRLTTGSGATTTITFSTISGGRMPASLRPQLTIFRLPPGV